MKRNELRTNDYLAVPVWILTSDLNATEKLVAATIIDALGPNHEEAWPGPAKIAATLNISIAAVKRARKSLAARGILMKGALSDYGTRRFAVSSSINPKDPRKIAARIYANKNGGIKMIPPYQNDTPVSNRSHPPYQFDPPPPYQNDTQSIEGVSMECKSMEEEASGHHAAQDPQGDILQGGILKGGTSSSAQTLKGNNLGGDISSAPILSVLAGSDLPTAPSIQGDNLKGGTSSPAQDPKGDSKGGSTSTARIMSVSDCDIDVVAAADEQGGDDVMAPLAIPEASGAAPAPVVASKPGNIPDGPTARLMSRQTASAMGRFVCRGAAGLAEGLTAESFAKLKPTATDYTISESANWTPSQLLGFAVTTAAVIASSATPPLTIPPYPSKRDINEKILKYKIPELLGNYEYSMKDLAIAIEACRNRWAEVNTAWRYGGNKPLTPDAEILLWPSVIKAALLVANTPEPAATGGGCYADD